MEPASKRRRYNTSTSSSTTTTTTTTTAPPSYTLEALSPQLKRKLPSAGKCLMDLDNYSLLEIFDRLRNRQLRNLLQVNVRLNDLVQLYVRLKFGLCIQPDGCFDFRSADGQLMSNHAAKLYIALFGEQVSTLKFSRQSCTQRGCDGDLINVIRESSSAKSIIIENVYTPIDPFLLNSLRINRLENLQIKQANAGNFGIINFIEGHSSLKKLSIVNVHESSTYFFHRVGRLKELEDFEFKKWNQVRDPVPDLGYLVALKKLKVFKFGFLRKSYSPIVLLQGFVANGIKIEHLELENSFDGSSDETILTIARLKTIKILKLNAMNGLLLQAHLVYIAEQLKLLEELYIHTDSVILENGIYNIVNGAKRLSCFKIDAITHGICPESYGKILKSVQDRPEPIKLNLWIYGRLSTKFEFPVSNDQWLVVKQSGRNDSGLFENLEKYTSNRERGDEPIPINEDASRQFLLSEVESEIDIEDGLSSTASEPFDNGSESEDESGSEEQWNRESEDGDDEDESGSEIV